MADVPLKARAGGECDLQINSTYRALWSPSVGNVAGMEISGCAVECVKSCKLIMGPAKPSPRSHPRSPRADRASEVAERVWRPSPWWT